MSIKKVNKQVLHIDITLVENCVENVDNPRERWKTGLCHN